MPETSNRKSRFRRKSKSKKKTRKFEKDPALALSNRLRKPNLLARHLLRHPPLLRLVLDKRLVAADAAVDEDGVDVGGNKRLLKPSPPLRSRDRYQQGRPTLRKQESQKVISPMLQKPTAKCRLQWRLPPHPSFRQLLRPRRAPPRV